MIKDDDLKEAASDMQSQTHVVRCSKFLRQRCWRLVNGNWETAYTAQMAANGAFSVCGLIKKGHTVILQLFHVKSFMVVSSR